MIAGLLLATVIAGTQTPKTWTLLAGGDLMLNAVSAKKNPFEEVRDVVSGADIAYANLEIPLTSKSGATPRKSLADRKAKRQFVLKADPAHAAHLADVGFDVVSLGNNHAMDYGAAGLTEMLGLLDGLGIAYSGAGNNWAEAMRPANVSVPGGPKVAFYSMLAFKTRSALRTCWPATTDQPGIGVLAFDASIDAKARETLKSLVDRARRQADLVVFALHWGTERKTVPDPYQIALGRATIDAGADLVLGAHPHVLQGSEVYREKPILYSMGNLISPLGGETALYKLSYQGTKFQKLDVVPIRYGSSGIGRLSEAQSATALKRIAGLDASLAKAYPKPK